MKGVKMNLNMDVVNCVLLVVILALVIYCVVKQNEGFQAGRAEIEITGGDHVSAKISNPNTTFFAGQNIGGSDGQLSTQDVGEEKSTGGGVVGTTLNTSGKMKFKVNDSWKTTDK
jgi:hypothetical protein